jgi:hypothetical protein
MKKAIIIEIPKTAIQQKANQYHTTYAQVAHNLQRYLGISDWTKKEDIPDPSNKTAIDLQMAQLLLKNIQQQSGFHYEIMDETGRIITNELLGIRDISI